MATKNHNLSKFDSPLPSAADMRFGIVVAEWNREVTEALLEGHTCRLVTYGMHKPADFQADDLRLARAENFLGICFHVKGQEQMDVKVNMPGEFSVYNSLAAIAVGFVNFFLQGKRGELSLIHI